MAYEPTPEEIREMILTFAIMDIERLTKGDEYVQTESR